MSATEEHDWMPVPVPKSVLYFTKEASEYQCEESDEEVQEAEGEEEDSDKKNQKKDLKRTWTQQRTAPENPVFLVHGTIRRKAN